MASLPEPAAAPAWDPAVEAESQLLARLRLGVERDYRLKVLGQALAPAALVGLIMIIAWLLLLMLPGLLAARQETGAQLRPEAFFWTKEEARRLRASELARDGVLAAKLEPWTMPASGVGASARGGEGPRQQRLIVRLAGLLRGGGGEQAAQQVFAGLGEGGQAADHYNRALAASLYDPETAEKEAEAALGKIATARTGLKPDASGRYANETTPMRLDGAEVAVQYLRGHILLKRGKAGDAAKAFGSAINVARRARTYRAYASVEAPLYRLQPKHHLVRLSLGDLWADYLNALRRDDPERAWAEAQPLYAPEMRAGAHPELAAMLQLMAAERGQPVLVRRIAGAAPAGVGPAQQLSAVARLAMGDGEAAGLLAGLPAAERAVFEPWLQIGPERAVIKSRVSGAGGELGGISKGLSGDGQGFVREWRAAYQRRIGEQLLAEAWASHDRQDFLAILRPDIFDLDIEARAALGWWGWRWWGGALLLLSLGVLLSLALSFALTWWETFRPLHYQSRRARGRLAGA